MGRARSLLAGRGRRASSGAPPLGLRKVSRAAPSEEDENWQNWGAGRTSMRGERVAAGSATSPSLSSSCPSPTCYRRSPTAPAVTSTRASEKIQFRGEWKCTSQSVI